MLKSGWFRNQVDAVKWEGRVGSLPHIENDRSVSVHGFCTQGLALAVFLAGLEPPPPPGWGAVWASDSPVWLPMP
jgi:hypothetical protein